MTVAKKKKRVRRLIWQPSKMPKIGDLIWMQPRDRRRKPTLYKVTAMARSD